ncbi:MAG: helix-turn-helix domain-containing protein [Pseudobdellovibrionaceae bacterium]
MKNMVDVLSEVLPKNVTPGELIRATRTNFGITQDEICEVTGLKRANLSAIENGRIEMTVHYAEVLGAALGLHPSTILFPRGKYAKKKEILDIEKRAKSLFKKHAVGF